ncbi:hypothetical protein AB0O34_34695 [Sphaerisporangium sp. NPDC088356]|uniref:hypothetical protein n=1 Tax=Sphaerisporangium sp. NPDC088356 TaxID=3154871 RepID=UPI003419DB54
MTGTAYEPTVEELRDRFQHARDAFAAAGGKLPGKRVESENAPLTCEQLLAAASITLWYAQEAAIQGYGDVYTAYYLGLSEAYAAQATASGCW